jgi:Cu/Ag efflux protein CusF
MKTTSFLAKSTVWLAGMLLALTALAQVVNDMAGGEVRKVDKDASKVTIKHGEIKTLDMPPMTMVFTVKDPALLEVVKAGDKVKFSVIREDGKLVLTAVQVVP